eukprot:4668331-Lingulodinium_polyedra.AAC.1
MSLFAFCAKVGPLVSVGRAGSATLSAPLHQGARGPRPRRQQPTCLHWGVLRGVGSSGIAVGPARVAQPRSEVVAS